MSLKLDISKDERKELERIVATHAKNYMRERASAILQIADGRPGLQVAKHGLLQVRRENTVYEWVHRFEAEGIEGLKNKPGRGRKPSFSPSE